MEEYEHDHNELNDDFSIMFDSQNPSPLRHELGLVMLRLSSTVSMAVSDTCDMLSGLIIHRGHVQRRKRDAKKMEKDLGVFAGVGSE